MRAWFTMVILLSVALSGCAGETEDYTPFEPTDSVEGDGTNETMESNVTVEEVVNTPPTAELGIEGFNATDVVNGTLDITLPATLNFTLGGDDADGDNMTWELAINGTSVANGTDLPAVANHTFETEGLHNVTFTVSDGVNETVELLQLNATLGGFTPTYAFVEDSGSDGEQFVEILSVEANNDGETLRVDLTLADVWPSTQAVSGATYSVNVNGNLYTSFVRYAIDSNPMTWDHGEGAYMAAGTSSWSGDVVTFNLPIAHLEGKGAVGPYEVFTTANYGALTTREVIDTAPDAGTLQLQ